MMFQDYYTIEKGHMIQLSVNADETLESLIEEVEQIQEDIADDDVDFIDLEKIRNELVSAKETFEKILKRNRKF